MIVTAPYEKTDIFLSLRRRFDFCRQKAKNFEKPVDTTALRDCAIACNPYKFCQLAEKTKLSQKSKNAGHLLRSMM